VSGTGTAIGSPVDRWRFQLDDHLGTSVGEVTEDGLVIGWEEFHPYGTTALWSFDSTQQVSAKRYRYTGMERDDETGLQLHSARYYLPWLGRWERPDPAGLVDGPNLFRYARCSPARHQDTTGLEPPVEEDSVSTTDLEPGTKWWSEQSAEQQQRWRDVVGNPSDTDAWDDLVRGYVGEQGFDADSTQNLAVARWGAAGAHWSEGNYLSAAGNGFFAITNKVGVMTFLGDSPAESVGYAGANVVLGFGLAKGFSLGAAYGLPLLGGITRFGGARIPSLIHFTDDAGVAGIAASGEIRGSYGIFALGSEAAQSSRLAVFMRSMIPWSKTANYVPIPDAARHLFRPITPIGPYSLLKRFAGTYIAPPGAINTATGAFTAGPGAWGSSILGVQAPIYRIDLLIYGAVGTGGAGLPILFGGQSEDRDPQPAQQAP